MSERNRPMPMAEFDECCGRYCFAFLGPDSGDYPVEYHCQNCPLLIERKRERVLRQARAS